MRSTTIGAAALILAVLGAPHIAPAQTYTNYPFCAVYDLLTKSCAFMTFAQCLATVSGRGGFCEANPFYRPPRARRKARRFRPM